MKNRIYKILVVFLLFSLQSFLYAEMKYLNKKGMTVEDILSPMDIKE